MAVTPSPTLSPTPEAHAPCKLLGGAFAYFIQLLLGVLALSALFVKRWRERPQRPLKVFLYDAAKQALIALVAHLFNMLVALMLKAQTHEDAAVAACQDFAEHYFRLSALHCTATARSLIPAECSAIP